MREANPLRWIVLVAIAIWFSGCSATIPVMPDEFDADAERFEPRQGKANIYVVRESAFAGSAVLFQVILNGMVSGAIAPGTYLLFEVPPGNNNVTVITQENSDSEVIVASAGENYFVEIAPEWGIMAARASVSRVGQERGRQLVLDGERGEPMTSGAAKLMTSKPSKAKSTQEGDDPKPADKTVRELSDQLTDGRYALILSRGVGHSFCDPPFHEGKKEEFSVVNGAVKQERSHFIRVRSRDIRIDGDEFSATFLGPAVVQGRVAMRLKGDRIDNGFQGKYNTSGSNSCRGEFKLLRVAQ